MLEETIAYVILFTVAIIAHEFGHYVGFWIIKRKPLLKFHWFGLIEVYCRGFRNITIKEAILVYYLGVFFGLGFFISTPELMGWYLAVCCVDITMIIAYISLGKDKRSWTVREVSLWDSLK